MKIKKIRLENIRSYKFQELNFPNGSVLLWGNIGSGKSSILLGIDFALFGLQKGNLSGGSLLRNGEERGSVELFLEVNNKDYVIKRGLKKSKSGVVQDFGYIISDGIKEEKTAIELKEKVLDILDYPKNLLTKNKALIFRYTVYTPQEEMKLILLGNKEERLDVLRKVFGIDKYKRINENCSIIDSYIKMIKKEKEGYVSDLDSKIVDRINREKEIKIEDERYKEINLILESTKKRLEEKKQETKIIEEKKEVLNKLNKDIELNKLNLNHKKGELNENKKRIEEFELIKTPEIKAIFQRENLEKLEAGIKIFENELRNMLDKIQELKTKRFISIEIKEKVIKLDKCPTCLQNVHSEHKKKIIEEEDNRVKAIEDALLVLSNKRIELEKKINETKITIEKEKSKENENRIERLKLEQYNDRKNEITKLKEKNNIIIDEIKNIETRNKTLIQIIIETNFTEEIFTKIKKETEQVEYDFKKNELEKREIEVKIGINKKNIEILEKEISKKQETKSKIEHLNKVQFWLENHFSILMNNMEKSVMFKIHEDFNSLFEKWFGLLVENENLQITLDEEFSPRIYQNGYDTEYDYLSGGERTAGALAYRLALNQVVNNLMSSIKTNGLLILDEPTEGFSSEQLEKMRALIEELNMEQIIIVSHESKVESFVDNILKFEKTEHVTRVVS